MPVRLLSSSVIRWPDRDMVDKALRDWSDIVVRKREGILRIGYFGSYATGGWGVGSDLDIVIVVDRSELPFIRRAVEFDLTGLPVPADIIVYTSKEWDSIDPESRFGNLIKTETVWVYRSC